MSGFSGTAIAVVGAGGHLGQTLIRMFLAGADRPRRIVALDKDFATSVADQYEKQAISIEALDICVDAERLEKIFHAIDLVVNVAGPFYLLDTYVLEAAIAARVDYVDICDDADTATRLLALDKDAQTARVSAVIGAGSAPGITNVLGRLALDCCPGDMMEKRLKIAWVTPVHEVSRAIFQHICHCLASLAPEGPEFPSWESLKPEKVRFAEPIGEVETILFGHPESVTFPHCLGLDIDLRGAAAPAEMMHIAWCLSALMAQHAAADARKKATDDAYEVFSRCRRIAGVAAGNGNWGGLYVEARCGDRGVRIRTASDDSMSETTIIPCMAFARMVANGLLPGTGVFSPEMLAPVDFFSSLSARTGKGKVQAFLVTEEDISHPVSIKELLARGSGLNRDR